MFSEGLKRTFSLAGTCTLSPVLGLRRVTGRAVFKWKEPKLLITTLPSRFKPCLIISNTLSTDVLACFLSKTCRVRCLITSSLFILQSCLVPGFLTAQAVKLFVSPVGKAHSVQQHPRFFTLADNFPNSIYDRGF